MNTDHTIDRWLTDSARSYPDRVAVDDRGVGTTYAGLERRVGRLSERLTRGGYRAGDRIATVTGSSTDHVVWFFACARLGIALVPLSWRSAPAELAHALRVADPMLVVVEDAYATVAGEGLALLPEPINTARFDTYGVPPRAHHTPAGPRRGPHNDDPLLIIFTSGSTGRPKAAVLTHDTCFWTNLSFSRVVPLNRDDVVLSVLPQHHAGGWNVQPLLAWSVGATVVLERTFDARRILQLIPARGITAMMGVPTHYRRLSEEYTFAETDLSTLRTAVVGGAPASAAVLRTWHARGVRLTQGYGLTEAGPNVLCLPPEDALERVGSAGRPYPHVEVALAEPVNGEPVVGPATGELLVRGPGLFAGYLGDPVATDDALRDGWLHTGDLATRDEAGYYSILGRTDDVYISGGENIAPVEVEEALLTHPAVAQAAVVGVPDDIWGEVGHAHVVLRPGATVDSAELIAHVRAQLAAFKAPARITFADALPTAGIDKVSRRALREESRR
ncbi:AMP-binding protein [Tessaracoccus sp. MC1865]|uniref:class I adenylate-forming enzyme family protein n=1 Tax=Tessaracoccus sp. MC1865 TaxID=2760310 RepID=UPI001603DFE9|nr:AMP-binding protein [Tessaracoccus sp. MC1865]MBB1483169.1 AMP-binding protein [Tessaracoccus sp. MC1865]QTO37408.1 AMP-binding protein [Tessaracoccus sp. MC1865]